jgi:hypothetical protein
MNFIKVAGQLVREDAITRLSSNPAAGAPAVQFFVHFVDGGSATLSEDEYRKLKKRLDPPKSSRKKPA